jgi:hypothetical protein
MQHTAEQQLLLQQALVRYPGPYAASTAAAIAAVGGAAAAIDATNTIYFLLLLLQLMLCMTPLLQFLPLLLPPTLQAYACHFCYRSGVASMLLS